MQNNTIEELIKEKTQAAEESRPTLFDLSRQKDRKFFEQLISEKKIQHISDDYKEQQKEYFAVMNPTLVYTEEFEHKFLEYFSKLQQDVPLWQHGRWVYFPWISTIVHILEEEPFYVVRTDRNRNLINADEQKKFYNGVVGIAGLSIGNGIALAIVLQGGARRIRIADLDRLALSNTNRIRAGLGNLGLLKTEVTARQIYEMNPYAIVDVFSEGLTKENIKNFFNGPPKLNVVIDELDNLAVKFLIRTEAKRCRIAVVMGADDGDNAVLDIERFDQNPNLKFFHGRMGEVSYDTLANLDKFATGRMIAKHVGPENVPQRMQESLSEMGKTIVSWPQLGGAALINGSALAYCVRKILNKQPLEDNRALISLDEKLIPGYNTPKEKKRRQEAAEAFKKIFKL